VILAALACLLVAAVPVTSGRGRAGAQDLDELRRQREEIRHQRAEQAKLVDAAQADYDVLADALIAIEENVTAQESRVRGAEQAVAAAQNQVAAADDRIAAVEEHERQVHDDIRRLAMELYVGRDSGGTATDVLLGSTDPLEAARRQVLLDARIGNNQALVDELRAVEEDLERLRQEREAALQTAAEKAAILEQELAALEQARAEQAALVDEAELRLERMQAEAAALEQQDAEVSQQIRQREQEIAAALERARERRAAANRGGSGGGGGGGALPTVGSGDTASGGGIRVHSSISGNVASLVAAARGAGLNLGGDGWRSSDGQVALRRSNCGSSHYAIWEMPSSDCSPPTARPGASMHERGLAIDFVCNGSLITSRSSECFQWLAANAPSYGLQNLPSEPWHWSTNGG
jgi:peptidoglycan hydrolase CwlO-like protein